LKGNSTSSTVSAPKFTAPRPSFSEILFDIYRDQYDALQELALEERKQEVSVV
jgi:hypothetical protein